jgi:predicted  nucleic acid-binding Zn-ribbon protein
VTDPVVVAAEGELKQAEVAVEQAVNTAEARAQVEIQNDEVQARNAAEKLAAIPHTLREEIVSEFERLKQRAGSSHVVVQYQHELAAFKIKWHEALKLLGLE